VDHKTTTKVTPDIISQSPVLTEVLLGGVKGRKTCAYQWSEGDYLVFIIKVIAQS